MHEHPSPTELTQASSIFHAMMSQHPDLIKAALFISIHDHTAWHAEWHFVIVVDEPSRWYDHLILGAPPRADTLHVTLEGMDDLRYILVRNTMTIMRSDPVHVTNQQSLGFVYDAVVYHCQ